MIRRAVPAVFQTKRKVRDMRFLLIIGAMLTLAACTGKPSLDDDKLSGAELNLEEFFEGNEDYAAGVQGDSATGAPGAGRACRALPGAFRHERTYESP